PQPQPQPPASVPAPTPPSQGSQPTPYGNDPYAGPRRTELPPLRNIQPDSMTGVQYSASRVHYGPGNY
ncbi:hypothetical protein E4U41_002241, partial [Claviceps citrina]